MLLAVKDLIVDLYNRNAAVHALRGVGLGVAAGQRVGLVGESGSGKTMTVRSIMGLLPPQAVVRGGQILFDGTDLLTQSESSMERVRGRKIGVIFQNAQLALNPVMSVGQQVADVYRRHRGGNNARAWMAAVEMLGRVAFPKPAVKARAYPHELSGGLCQRVLVAMSLVCSPRLLIADEPTTGLDVTIQRQVVDLIVEMTAELESALLFVSHDIDIVADACNSIAVMYAGRIVEFGPTEAILSDPLHPYSQGLISSLRGVSREHMPFIAGQAPDLSSPVVGCSFANRCEIAVEACREVSPALEAKRPGRWVSCHRVEPEEVSGGSRDGIAA